jgi:hypothetical protein
MLKVKRNGRRRKETDLGEQSVLELAWAGFEIHLPPFFLQFTYSSHPTHTQP